MKKLSFIISCLFVFLCTKSIAQAQWKFHLAFEDATGAKDTIWFIWDTSAVLWDYDPLLGEGHVDIDTDIFSVWLINHNNDTTKTQADPFNTPLQFYVYGTENFQYPITLSWDSSLFHSPDLPQPVNLAYMDNQYFFGHYNNSGSAHRFNMLLDNHVTVDFFGFDFFPIFINIERDAVLDINENISISKKKPLISPNPASDFIRIKSDKNIKDCLLIDNTGRVVLNKLTENTPYSILSVQDIRSGCYILKIINQNNEAYYEKIIVNH